MNFADQPLLPVKRFRHLLLALLDPVDRALEGRSQRANLICRAEPFRKHHAVAAGLIVADRALEPGERDEQQLPREIPAEQGSNHPHQHRQEHRQPVNYGRVAARGPDHRGKLVTADAILQQPGGARPVVRDDFKRRAGIADGD